MPEIDTSELYIKRLLSEDGNQPVDAGANSVELELPPWYNEELFKRGQYYYKRYLWAMFSSMLTGLIAVLAIPSILKVLICTKKSGTPIDAYRRYVETIYHILAWNNYELKPGSKAWKSIEMVRKLHISSRKMCEKAENISIVQRDMALTQFGFMGFSIAKPHLLGMPADEDFLESTVHFWRVLGYLIGIKDDLNLCTDSYKTTKERVEIVLDRIYRPALENADDNFEVMTKALINGMWYFNCLLKYEPVMYFTKRLAGCSGYEYFESDFKTTPTCEQLDNMKYKSLGWYDRYKVYTLVYAHQFLYPNYLVLQYYFNFQSYMSQVISYYFPILAIISHGVKKAYVRIFRGNSKQTHVD